MRFAAATFLLVLTGSVTASEFADNWHRFRGPEATGVSRSADPPLTWSEDENVHWKVAIEGQGGSSPIIWGDKIFLLTAVDTKRVDPSKTAPEDQTHVNPFGIKYPNTYHQYVVLCLDRTTGEIIWRRMAKEMVPIEGHHRDNDFASSSPTTEGQRLYVWFGSAGLYCYSLDGELLWQRDLGPAETRLSFGEASSPLIHDDKLILMRDLDSQSYVTVLNAKNGKTIWRKERDEPSCWATPIVVEHEGVEQLITNAHNRVRSYNLANGDVIWECGGQVSNVTPSPVTDGEAVYSMSGYRGSSALAIPLGATSDITESDQIIWSKNRGTPYVPSPLLYDGLLYFNQSNNAILTCLDAKTGETLIERTRMPNLNGLYASPVGASGRVYFVGRNGVTLVLEKGPEFKVLATNQLDEPIDATPALVGNQIFLRGEKSLYCIGKK
jgi:hypothetical protein